MSSTPPPLPPVDDESPGRTVDQDRARVFPCEGCGADLEFDISVQSLQCPYCGHTKALEVDEEAAVREQDLREQLAAQSERRRAGSDEKSEAGGLSEVTCGSCGGTVQFHGTLTSDDCPYCGTPMQLTGVHDAEDRVAVDGVLPFQIERDQAKQNLKKWVESRWFAPSEFKRRGVQGKFNGVYMPYWTFDALTMNRYRGERGEHYYVTVGDGDDRRQERRTRWWPESGSFRRFFDDILVCAGTGLPRKVERKLGPWPLEQVMPFNQQVLSGLLARTYDVQLKAGFDEAETRIESAIRSDVRDRIGGDEQRIHDIDTDYGALTYKHLLLPVWMLAYRYGDKSYQVVVNAATGEVQGERPWSWLKIAGLVLGIAAVGGAIAYFAR